MTARRVAVVTPWYPDPHLPFRGSFVRAMVEATAPGTDRLDVYHLNGWPVTRDRERLAAVEALQERLLPRSVRPVPTAGGAVLHRIAAAVERVRDHAVHARRHAWTLRGALAGEPLAAPVVHAHVPMLGGYAALENARPDAKVYATEHSSFLAEVLADTGSRDLYDEILDRLDGCFVVGEPLFALLGEAFPHHAAKIGYLANPVDFTSRRPEPPAELRRWLSVAAFNERKRIDYLLRAFADCRAEDPELTLTLAGDGELRPELEALTAELGLAGAVEFLGAVEPDRIPALMAEHDLFVHASRHETFGVVVVEALAAGTPVLATRSGGSDQVLDGVEDDAGALFDVVDDPAALVDAYLALRERHPHKTDLDRARAHLSAKYSYAAVADRHHRIWFGGER
ncbi:glycosyltransferase family 4 protein [Glycomyces sp. NPDC046736]|uniref:glycosyltransferase family 4 protein n=1 Tax=Glycomyces sp. NPDC046736 TaxID=3155615 RepID=UPI0033DE0D09